MAVDSAASPPRALSGWRSPPLTSLIVAAIAPQLVAAQAQDLGTVLAQNGNVSTYYGLIQKYPEILLQLPNYAGVTVVAPSNEAFNKSQGWSSDNETMVTDILEYHLLQGTVATGAVPEGPADFVASMLRSPAYTNVTGGQRVIVYKQPGDTVIFASGSGSRSTLLEGDIPFAGGLVQVVDTLLVPPARLEPTARLAYPDDLTAFMGAVYAAGLDGLFAETPDVTIFAPRNVAFQRVAGALEGLPADDLATVLRYHLVTRQYLPSTSLTNGTDLTTAASGLTSVNGTEVARSLPLRVTRAGNNLYVDSAQVVQPDILLANGVLHIVDDVLDPNATGALPDPALPAQPPVFAAPASGPGATATATGRRAPTPFTSALPCTSACPTPTTALASSGVPGNGTAGVGGGSSKASGGSVKSTSSSHGAAAAAGARCTGLVGGVLRAGGAAGVVGLGVGVGMGMGMGIV